MIDDKIAAVTDGGNAKQSGADPSDPCADGDAIRMNLAGPAAEESAEFFTFGRRLRRARLARQWSQLQLAHRMREVGAAHRGAATMASLLIMLSKWENDRKHPNQYNLHLLATALEIPVFELGLPVDRDFVF
jgi:hypothetical protein